MGGPIIAFVNMKGGVGKTTLAYAVATCASKVAKRKLKVLAVDLDPQANLTQKFLAQQPGFETTVQTNNIRAFFEKHVPLSQLILPTKFDEVKIVPSHIGLATIEQQVLTSPTGTSTVKFALEELRNDFDLFVIDCPPNFGAFALNAVVAADTIICPVTPDFMSLEGFKYLKVAVDQLARTPLGKDKKLGMIINLVDKRYYHHRSFIDLMKNNFPEYVIGAFSRRATLQRAVEIGESPWTEVQKSAESVIEDLKNFLQAVLRLAGVDYSGAPQAVRSI